MKRQYDSKKRKELRLKMARVFSDETQMLSIDLQNIFFDDLATAFENRLKVLAKEQPNLAFEVISGVERETFQA